MMKAVKAALNVAARIWDVPPKTVASYQLPPVDVPGVVPSTVEESVTSCQSVSSRRVVARGTDTLETGNQ
jgi:hypothetical protein